MGAEGGAAARAAGHGSGHNLAPATVRAYASDLRAVRTWCRTRGIVGGMSQLDAKRVFAHCVDLLRDGRSRSTVRRRLTALRSHLEAGGTLGVSSGELFDIERRILKESAGTTSVLVLSDDPITRAGLRAVLDDTGVLSWSEAVGALDVSTLTVWDYVLVWVAVRRGVDGFAAVQRFEGLDSSVTTTVPIVAVHSGVLTDMARLRMSEAGFRYAVPHAWLSNHLDRLSLLLTEAALPRRYHLETPLALRQMLGLRLGGELGPLLRVAAQMPAEVWASHVPQEQLPISRTDVHRLRRLALESAGVPAPDFLRFATSMRRPPDSPEWSTVRDVVRSAFDMTNEAPRRGG